MIIVSLSSRVHKLERIVEQFEGTEIFVYMEDDDPNFMVESHNGECKRINIAEYEEKKAKPRKPGDQWITVGVVDE